MDTKFISKVYDNLLFKVNEVKEILNPSLIPSQSNDYRILKPTAGKWKSSNEYKFIKGNDTQWVASITMGSIIKVKIIPFYTLIEPPLEITKDELQEMIIFLALCYFSLSTELRLLSSKSKIIHIQSEKLHAKSAEICCRFLPNECPLVDHITSSYFKFYSAIEVIVIILSERRGHFERRGG